LNIKLSATGITLLIIGSIGRFGNAHTGTLIGPKTVNFSLGLGKTFQLNERFKLMFDSSFTNVPNHVNFDDPGNNLTDGHFGQVTSARSGDAGGSRVGHLVRSKNSARLLPRTGPPWSFGGKQR
jgi:hypothetical protein